MRKKKLVSFARSVRQGYLLLATAPILLYQKTLSFDHGPMKGLYPYGYCPFYPSCSEYCRLSILRYGLIGGIAKGSYRILRCHPLTKGGVDLP
ncbi:TPA: membrane protein insertion efficiency factor YidD [Candidatus Uhrbacteria bacterium]|nr:membrane protein insertion efficiency factor YidD [Candidatus Uhrbacteria bacterium]